MKKAGICIGGNLCCLEGMVREEDGGKVRELGDGVMARKGDRGRVREVYGEKGELWTNKRY